MHIFQNKRNNFENIRNRWSSLNLLIPIFLQIPIFFSQMNKIFYKFHYALRNHAALGTNLYKNAFFFYAFLIKDTFLRKFYRNV